MHTFNWKQIKLADLGTTPLRPVVSVLTVDLCSQSESDPSSWPHMASSLRNCVSYSSASDIWREWCLMKVSFLSGPIKEKYLSVSQCRFTIPKSSGDPGGVGKPGRKILRVRQPCCDANKAWRPKVLLPQPPRNLNDSPNCVSAQPWRSLIFPFNVEGEGKQSALSKHTKKFS